MDEKKSRRGFGSMTKERQKQIASMGGKAAHAKGTAHRFSHEEAARAGKIGGMRVSQDAEHMKQIGRLGGAAKRRRREEQTEEVAPDDAEV